MKTFTPQLESCRIVVKNDVLGTVQEYDSPQSASDALDADGNCNQAYCWFLATFDEDMPIGVAILKTAERVLIHWHPVSDDMDAVGVAMREALDGSWGVPPDGSWGVPR